MKYHCGHNACDICGGRECAGLSSNNYGNIRVCKDCLHKALKFALGAAEQWGGNIIDPDKPCPLESPALLSEREGVIGA